MSLQDGIKHLENFFKNAKSLLPKDEATRTHLIDYLLHYKNKRINGTYNLMPKTEAGTGVEYQIEESRTFVVVKVFKDDAAFDVHLTIPKLQGQGDLQKDSVHITNEKNQFRSFMDYDTGEVKGEIQGELPEPAAPAPLSQGARAAIGAVGPPRGMPGSKLGKKKGGTRRAGPSIYPTKSSHSFVPRMRTRRVR